MGKAQTPEPSFGQNRFPRSRTKKDMKERAERTLMMPKIPVRKREDEKHVAFGRGRDLDDAGEG